MLKCFDNRPESILALPWSAPILIIYVNVSYQLGRDPLSDEIRDGLVLPATLAALQSIMVRRLGWSISLTSSAASETVLISWVSVRESGSMQ